MTTWETNKRIAFYTLGCKVNQYETQMLAERFEALGFDVVDMNETADVYVINSCTVTGMADKKSRNFARRAKRRNPEALTVLAGCYAEVAGDILRGVEEIDLLVGSAEKERLPEILCGRNGIFAQESNDVPAQLPDGADADSCRNAFPRVGQDDFQGAFQKISQGETPGAGMRRGVTGLHDRTRAFVKVEDGCDRYCAYCIIPYARGPVRSRPLDEIVSEARALIANGYKEIVLTGVNAALYGSAGGILDVVDAVSEIGGTASETGGAFRIRLSSLEPTVINADYARELIKRERLCPHLHLSLQSGSDRILRAMGRRYSMDDYRRIVDVLKKHDAGYAVTTDLIVGFPGETDADFEETLNAVAEIGFSHIHVFKYSKRKGTAAAEMDGQIPEQVKSARSERLMAAGEKAAAAFVYRNRGTSRQTLFYGKDSKDDKGSKDDKDNLYRGITDNGIEVRIHSTKDLTNRYADICIEDTLSEQ
ncbi:MAG: tRNA (N(6)-L-threonylcarbamoyladenosine(37)-C(2))-methylthiotransferase MtaB [Clostridiales Family XIII bacterium]|jgi:threonylcarbamoyladenosine tRNA methylthiotransferase MtaB|nr:tRNA (N(6)-L-threonylcarbamoyladenosine(37)-C(2))-methylthiotransferase MtaB [Clostridiales Family XIII bacterium]